MVKSFFVGMGAVVAVLWGLWGLFNFLLHFGIGPKGNWWGSWDWVSVAPLILGILFGIGWVFVRVGEYIREEW